MPRYMVVAAEANGVAVDLLALVPESEKPKAAEMIAKLVNYGVRCSPRGVQHTVRFNAVRRAVQSLPVRIGMKEVRGINGRSFNALVTEPICQNNALPETVEGLTDEE